MSEAKAIENAPAPRTRASLAADLRQLGIEPGMVLLVHSSMRSLGWVSGGPVAMIQALQDVLTDVGTLWSVQGMNHLVQQQPLSKRCADFVRDLIGARVRAGKANWHNLGPGLQDHFRREGVPFEINRGPPPSI